MSEDKPLKKYAFTISGVIWAGSENHAKHSLFWMIENSEWCSDVINKEITVEGEK